MKKVIVEFNTFFSSVKNFSYLIIAQFIYKLFSFLFIILIVRFLSVDGFGQLSFGLALVWIFLFVSDLGLTELFVRDIAYNHRLISKYAGNIISLKLLLALSAYGIVVILGLYFFGVSVKFYMVALLGLAVIFDSFMYFFRSYLHSREKMGQEAILLITESILKVCLLFFIIKLKVDFSGVILVSLAILSVSLINLLLNLAIFLKDYGRLQLSFDRNFLFELLKKSFPFALIYILSLINFRVDIIMLSLLKSNSFAGIYGADYKLLEQFLLIPLTFSWVALPMFSRLSRNPVQIRKLFMDSMFFLFFLASLSLFLFYIFGAKAINILYGGDFKQAENYLYLLSWVMLPFFLKPILEKLFFSLGRQLSMLRLYLCGVIIHLILNLFLIPKFGINGAAFSTVICESAVVLITLIWANRLLLVSSVKKQDLLPAGGQIALEEYLHD